MDLYGRGEGLRSTSELVLAAAASWLATISARIFDSIWLLSSCKRLWYSMESAKHREPLAQSVKVSYTMFNVFQKTLGILGGH